MIILYDVMPNRHGMTIHPQYGYLIHDKILEQNEYIQILFVLFILIISSSSRMSYECRIIIPVESVVVAITIIMIIIIILIIITTTTAATNITRRMMVSIILIIVVVVVVVGRWYE